MKKQILLSFIILLFTTNNFAQNKTIDSLKLALKIAEHDTTRCNILATLVETLFPKEGWKNYNEELIKLSESKLITNNPSSFEHKFYLRHYAASLNNVGYLHKQQGNFAKAIEYYQKSLKIKEDLGDKEGLAASFNNIAAAYDKQGDIIKALECYQKSLKIYEEIGDKKYISRSLKSIAVIYNNQGNIAETLKYYQKSLEVSEKIDDKQGIAECFLDIGLIYKNQGDIVKALEYTKKSLKIQEETDDKKGIAYSFNNIGMIYKSQGNLIQALEYIQKSLTVQEDIADKRGAAISLNNIGMIYWSQADTIKSLEYYQKSLKLSEEISDKKITASVFNNMAIIYRKKGDFSKAIEYFQKSLSLSNKLGFPANISSASKGLYDIYKDLGDKVKALEYYEIFIQMRDSINNQETKKTALKQQIKYEYEKKQDSTKLENEKRELFLQKEIQLQQLTYEYQRKQTLAKSEEEKKQLRFEEQFKRQQIENDHAQREAAVEAEHKRSKDLAEAEQQKNNELAAAKLGRQKTIALISGIGIVLLLILLGFLFNRFRVIQKQKNIIELKEKETQQQNEVIKIQKHLVEEKHKEITDSINYAERIQRSFLATEKQLNENLSNCFVLFKPKDVVSGDFYWSAKLSNDNFALVTADSTGHGVPGAIMSLLNVTSLEKAIEHYTNPADILNHTRQTIIERLKKDGSEEGGKDGMDCSLLVFDFTNKELFIAAANNPVWIIRENEMIEIKPDKMPVGKNDKQDQSFTTHTIKLQKGDTIYTLTDGFPDQFGGDKGKKFMSKKLKELLLANVHLPITQQKELLDSTFKNWVGNLEQVDDVTVIGIKV